MNAAEFREARTLIGGTDNKLAAELGLTRPLR